MVIAGHCDRGLGGLAIGGEHAGKLRAASYLFLSALDGFAPRGLRRLVGEIF